MTRRTTVAPDFGEAPYPSAGARIGPAWQAVWDALHSMDEATGADLGIIVAATVDLTDAMVTRLLREACAAGWLYATWQGKFRRDRAVYRLTWAARSLDNTQPPP